MILANKDINVVTKDVSYTKISEGVESIVQGAFDEFGVYHAYLHDYCFACKLLNLFTDYSGNDFDEVLEIYESDEWKYLYEECGSRAEKLLIYSIEEIEDRRLPMAQFNELAVSINKIAKKIGKAADGIDFKKIMKFVDNLDVDSINKVAKLIGGK